MHIQEGEHGSGKENTGARSGCHHRQLPNLRDFRPPANTVAAAYQINCCCNSPAMVRSLGKNWLRIPLRGVRSLDARCSMRR